MSVSHDLLNVFDEKILRLKSSTTGIPLALKQMISGKLMSKKEGAAILKLFQATPPGMYLTSIDITSKGLRTLYWYSPPENLDIWRSCIRGTKWPTIVPFCSIQMTYDGT